MGYWFCSLFSILLSVVYVLELCMVVLMCLVFVWKDGLVSMWVIVLLICFGEVVFVCRFILVLD